MGRKYLFADEHGNFDFRDHSVVANGPTRYFAVGTAMVEHEDHVAELRGRLARVSDEVTWRGLPHNGHFHASEDKQEVRDAVYAAIADLEVTFDVTVLEKSKAQPRLYSSDELFFQYAWYYHLKFLSQRYFRSGDEWLILAGSLDVKKKRKAFIESVDDVVEQCVATDIKRRVLFRDAKVEPGLQVADYGLWAVMRTFNSGDTRSEEAIQSKVRHVYDLFAIGTRHYYGPGARSA